MITKNTSQEKLFILHIKPITCLLKVTSWNISSKSNKVVSKLTNYPKEKYGGGKKSQRVHRAGTMNCSVYRVLSNQILIKTPTNAIFTHGVGRNQKVWHHQGFGMFVSQLEFSDTVSGSLNGYSRKWVEYSYVCCLTILAWRHSFVCAWDLSKSILLGEAHAKLF